MKEICEKGGAWAGEVMLWHDVFVVASWDWYLGIAW